MIGNKSVKVLPDRSKRVYVPKKHKEKPKEVTKEK